MLPMRLVLDSQYSAHKMHLNVHLMEVVKSASRIQNGMSNKTNIVNIQTEHGRLCKNICEYIV